MKIDADSQTLEQMFYGLKKQYFVPKYQRDYSWKASDELTELWSDVIGAYNQSSDYFMGTILLARREKDKEYFDIIDGQQRTVSFMLLLTVIRDYSKLVLDGEISTNDLSSHNESEQSVADDLYTEVRSHMGKSKNYLRVTNKDQRHFEKALDLDSRELNTEVSNSSNRILKGKAFFQKEIQKEFFRRHNSLDSLKQFYEFCITKLKFVTITVEDDYDAYVLFESLNSKGMDLSVADLLKNKVLSNVSNESDQEIVLQDWDDIVNSISNIPSNFVDYIRVYWNAYKAGEVTKSNLYKSIRKDIGTNSKKTKDFVYDLGKNAIEYDKLKNKANLNWPKINSKESWATDVAEMNLLGYTIHLPCFLYALNNREEILTELAYKSKVLLFRWVTICDFGIGEVDALFKDILKALKAGEDNKVILEKFTPLFSKVDDKVFKESFEMFQSENTKIMKYIIAKFHIDKNGSNLIPNFLQVDLEHILPQQVELWEADGLKGNFTLPYKRWIYSVGNVVLWEKSSNRSEKNSVFSRKVLKYKESDFQDTKQIANHQIWDEKAVVKRAKDLASKACLTWKLK